MPSPGQISDGEIWVRCWSCGDSDNPRHAHASISPEGLWHCVRCGAGGKLSAGELFEAIGDNDLSTLFNSTWAPTSWETIYNTLYPGPGTSRYSRLPRYHTYSGRECYDCFLCHDAMGDIIGISMVSNVRKIVGLRGICGSSTTLTSSPEHPLRLVEGPYDCIYPEDVCCYGLPDRNAFKYLRGHYLVLCPDADVWHDPGKINTIKRALLYNIYIMGVEILSEGDPDEVPKEDRLFVPKEELLDGWRSTEPTRHEYNIPTARADSDIWGD